MSRMAKKKYIFEVEKAKDGTPSTGPVYRSVFAKDGFPPPIPGLESCWDIFRMAVEKYPNNPMLDRREIVNGEPGKYEWQSYKEVYDIVIKVENAIRSCGVEKGGQCGIYGANSAEWIMSMESAVHLQDEIRAKAIRLVANKLYLLSYISGDIEQFATNMLLSAIDERIPGLSEFGPSTEQKTKVEAFIKTAATIYKKIHDGVFDVSNETLLAKVFGNGDIVIRQAYGRA